MPPVARSLLDTCVVSDMAVLSWLFSFTYQESLVATLSFAADGWAGCLTLWSLPDGDPRVALALAGLHLPYALTVPRLARVEKLFFYVQGLSIALLGCSV